MLPVAGSSWKERIGSAAYTGSRRLFLSAEERARPVHVKSALITTLFGSALNVATLAFAAIVCGWLAFARSGCALSVGVAIFEVLVISIRCGVIVSFQRTNDEHRLSDADTWLCRFGWLALASSASWGGLCFLALATAHDAVLYAIPVMSTVGIAASISARNSAVPRLAKFQVVLSLGPILAGSVFADDHGFRSLLLLVPAMAAGLFILIDERNAQLLALIETRHELDLLSRSDAVTGIANRRAFDEQLNKRRGAKAPFALVMVDVDHFKAFNDTFGHPTGDLLLGRIATILMSELRAPGDLVARYGGEEFAILIDHVDLRGATAMAERVRARIEDAFSDAPAGGHITVSLGVAVGIDRGVADNIVQRADVALYSAKRNGRNRVEVSKGLKATDDDWSLTPASVAMTDLPETIAGRSGMATTDTVACNFAR